MPHIHLRYPHHLAAGRHAHTGSFCRSHLDNLIGIGEQEDDGVYRPLDQFQKLWVETEDIDKGVLLREAPRLR